MYIQIIGRRQETERITLAKSLTNGNKFEKGKTDVFDIDVPDLGSLRKIRFATQNLARSCS